MLCPIIKPKRWREKKKNMKTLSYKLYTDTVWRNIRYCYYLSDIWYIKTAIDFLNLFLVKQF